MEDKIVIEQYYKLRSCRAVAELYRCSDETIRRILKANGIKLTGWKKPERTTPKRNIRADMSLSVIKLYANAVARNLHHIEKQKYTALANAEM